MDRNYQANAVDQILPGSLSARRAWIEIPAGCWRESRRAVALRKESVDRNTQRRDFKALGLLSLSARRAWIEICGGACVRLSALVALRKESVDRNHRTVSRNSCCLHGRSPQGERG